MRTSIILFLSFLFIASCSSRQKAADSEATTTAQTTTPEEIAQVQSNLAQGLLGDSTMFPYVYQGPGTHLIFEAYTMRFSLEHQQPLIPVTSDNVPWINSANFNVNNGLFITYIRNGREMSMQNPYVQVQYINKALPFCGTIDSVYMWMDKQFLEQGGGVLLADTYEIPTRSNQLAICKEYRTSPDAARHSGKHLAYAYVDYNEDYLIGFNYTAMTPSDFQIGHGGFYEIVKSFSFY